MTNTIDELLNRIDKHKGVYDPGKEEYLDWVFRYNCRKLERYDIIPKDNPEKLTELIQQSVLDTAKMVVSHYWKHNTHCKIYVPSIESIDELLAYDLKHHPQ